MFPYRGAYVRHLGRDEAVAEANQVLFFNAGEGYRVSHPVPGGDCQPGVDRRRRAARELAPPASCATAGRLAVPPAAPAHRCARAGRSWRCCDTACARTSPSLWKPRAWRLTLVQRALGPRTTHVAGASAGRQRLVDRAKLVLAGDLARRWTLGRDRRRAARLARVPDAGLPAGRGPAARTATSCGCASRARWTCSRSTTTSPPSASTSASPATAISAPRSARLTAAPPRSSGRPRCVVETVSR